MHDLATIKRINKDPAAYYHSRDEATERQPAQRRVRQTKPKKATKSCQK